MSKSKKHAHFEYYCANCGAPATKKALKARRDYKSAEPSDFDGLGTWRCSGKCKRGKVKVMRRLVAPASESAQAA